MLVNFEWKKNALTVQFVQILNGKENSLLFWNRSILQESVGFLHIQNPEQIS